MRGADGELKECACDERGYLEVGGDTGIKSRIAERTLKVTAEAADKACGKCRRTKKVTITDKQVCIYSENYERRAQAGHWRPRAG